MVTSDAQDVDRAPDGGGGSESVQVSRSELRTVLLSTVVGTTVEWYDFFLYGVAAGIVFNKLYFPSEDPVVGTLLAFATFAVGFVARPFGGLIFGHIGDRVGRKKTLIATMMIMGVATFLIGVLPTYASIGVAAPILLVVLRLAQGIAIGGEWGGAVLMSTEYAPPGRKGLFGSVPQMGLAIGLLLGTGVFSILTWVTSEEAFLAWGWRIAFGLSAVLVLVGLYIRLKVMETPAFRKLEKEEEKAAVPVLELVRSRVNRKHLWLGMGARWVEGLAFNTWAVFSIAYGTGTLGLSESTMLTAVMLAAVVLVVLIPVFGKLSDRFTRRTTYAWGTVAMVVMTGISFEMLNSGNTVVVIMAVVLSLGVVYPMMYGPVAAFFTELFPANVRYTGISIVYQLSGIFASGLTPLILTWLLARAGGDLGYVRWYFLAIGLLSLVCTLAIRPKDLVDDHAVEESA
ncbi:MFS transporter [Janibacter sp. GS2]|uniref:MFS transporter n=1 Tax=Janibacter sp. GS2 TaxID=3442646 RepID=UPI003EB8B4B8